MHPHGPRGRKERGGLTGRAFLPFLCLLAGAGASLCRAGDKADAKLLFLVARPPIEDPIFARSVVLMVPLEGESLVVGLIVNKPTRLTLADLFPKSPALKDRTESAYIGGPVDLSSPSLVFHSPRPAKEAMLLYDDVYLSFDPKFISRVMKDPKQSGDIRLFLGRAQWAPEQLQGEALEGSWYSLRAEGEVIFDRDSEHLWKRLHDRAKPPLSVQYRMPPSSRTEARTLAASLLPRP